jgi:hypothetical protein
MNYKDGPKKFNQPEAKMHTCRIPKEDGGAWHVQRVVGQLCFTIPVFLFHMVICVQ